MSKPIGAHRRVSPQSANQPVSTSDDDPGEISDVGGKSRKRLSRRFVIFSGVGISLALVAIAIIVMSGSSAPTNRNNLEMHGTLLVVGGGTPGIMNHVGPCGTGGGLANTSFLDVGAGAAVTVSSSTGEVLGIGTLSIGTSSPSSTGAPMGDCTSTFTVTNLPDSSYYQVEVANRGSVAVARSELSAVSLTVG